MNPSPRTDARSRAAGRLLVFLAPALALLPAGARAAHPLATDDVGTLGAAGLEVEVSGQSEPADGHLHFGTGVSVHAGLLEGLDLGATLLYGAQHLESGVCTTGFADPVLDLKWRLLDGDGRLPGLALRVDYRAPQPAGDLHTGHDLGLLLIGSWEGPRFATHLNVGGYRRGLATSEAHTALFLSGTVLARLSAGWSAGVEAVADGLGTPEQPLLAGMAAVAWEAAGDRVVSLGVGPSFDGGWGWIATVGLTAAFTSAR